MILGRSTQQWLGLITALSGSISAGALLVLPPDQAALVAGLLAIVTGFLGVLIAFIANTFTTPIDSPRLTAGTVVGVIDQKGEVIDQQTIAPAAGRKARQP